MTPFPMSHLLVLLQQIKSFPSPSSGRNPGSHPRLPGPPPPLPRPPGSAPTPSHKPWRGVEYSTCSAFVGLKKKKKKKQTQKKEKESDRRSHPLNQTPSVTGSYSLSGTKWYLWPRGPGLTRVEPSGSRPNSGAGRRGQGEEGRASPAWRSDFVVTVQG